MRNNLPVVDTQGHILPVSVWLLVVDAVTLSAPLRLALGWQGLAMAYSSFGSAAYPHAQLYGPNTVFNSLR